MRACRSVDDPSLTLSVHLVLNKCDLLQAKLQRGVRIRDSVPSFGDRKNDLPTATRCECIPMITIIAVLTDGRLT
jgi:hypothetical protein